MVSSVFFRTFAAKMNWTMMEKIEETNAKHWKVGEIVTLPRTTRLLKESGMKLYERYIGSRYICIREATDEQQGILLKVLGRTPAEYISMVCGEPFCKDDSMELLEGMCYSSYPFPTLNEVKDVLGILRSNPSLLKQFEAARMHINPNASFWIRETASVLMMKKPQCYDVAVDGFGKVQTNLPPYRITLAYFSQDQSIQDFE